MGPTGTGKSSFINLASGSDFAVGDGLKSCTAAVSESDPFMVDGNHVTLIDTPGFDDTTLSDLEVLKLIAVYLASTYDAGQKLNGVIYMHRISDFRMGGVSRKNFNMFRKLCGDRTLKNVAICTNMWSEVNEEVGLSREFELMTDDMLFKPILEKGASMHRHDGSLESARDLVLSLIQRQPRALRIQKELIDEGKKITETEACMELDREMALAMKRHQEEMQSLKEQMEEALLNKDAETKEELERVRRELEQNVKDMEQKRENLSKEYEADLQQMKERLRSLTDMLNVERQNAVVREQQINQAQMVHQQEMNFLLSELQNSKMQAERILQETMIRQEATQAEAMRAEQERFAQQERERKAGMVNSGGGGEGSRRRTQRNPRSEDSAQKRTRHPHSPPPPHPQQQQRRNPTPPPTVIREGDHGDKDMIEEKRLRDELASVRQDIERLRREADEKFRRMEVDKAKHHYQAEGLNPKQEEEMRKLRAQIEQLQGELGRTAMQSSKALFELEQKKKRSFAGRFGGAFNALFARV
ncbi:hypothetical protein K474DRAFT_1657166 [Panus rudis PR-1116 ss-1]|nr:hypothetical protein K474DRAFT_1657166 [Panus rudis PR-1116 ss-1]